VVQVVLTHRVALGVGLKAGAFPPPVLGGGWELICVASKESETD
jgi:hypothetical protein